MFFSSVILGREKICTVSSTTRSKRHLKYDETVYKDKTNKKCRIQPSAKHPYKKILIRLNEGLSVV